MRPAQAGNRTSSLAVEARHAGGGWLLRLRGRELDNALVDGQIVGVDKLEQDSVHPGGTGSRPPQAVGGVGEDPQGNRQEADVLQQELAGDHADGGKAEARLEGAGRGLCTDPRLGSILSHLEPGS
jgi:hypothetical protein